MFVKFYNKLIQKEEGCENGSLTQYMLREVFGDDPQTNSSISKMDYA